MDKIYKELFELKGVSSYENKVREYIEKELRKYSDEIIYDNLGSVFAVKKSKVKDAPTIMIAGHMDEVGAIVTKITEEGLLKITNIGGLMTSTLIGLQMEITTNKGCITGVVSSIPPHLLRENNSNSKKNTSIDDLLLDIGALNKEDAIELGVVVGDQVTFKNNYQEINNNKRVISKSIDNRWGCGMVIELLRDIHKMDLDVNLVIGATVQEEVGLRGAVTSSQMIKPDMFIALDVSPANDIGLEQNTIWGKLGYGYLLRFLDPRCIMHQGLKKFLINLSEEDKIKFQYFRSLGGTDAGAAQYAGNGTIVTTIGICARYIHSANTIMDKEDHESAKKILKSFVININKKTLENIKLDV